MQGKFDLYDSFDKIRKEKYAESMGWSVFTECWSPEDVAECFDDVTSHDELLKRMEDCAAVWDDRYADARSHRQW